ncbi:hypothetical protein AB0M43_38380 [Longispora sp. NPDC051575]|uniref:hypothetical protein n=1 Tax=Longispora sp. NPDC051575 TaxID=3154943 RepID=UPI0034239B18
MVAEDQAVERAGRLLYPQYWLMWVLPVPDKAGPVWEGAIAIAPDLVTDPDLPADVRALLKVATAYRQANPERSVVWFSDLTLWAYHQGFEWYDVGVRDWEAALDYMAGDVIRTPQLMIGTNARMAHTIADATVKGVVLSFTNGTEERITPDKREHLRDFLRDLLRRDWPPYIQSLIDAGKFGPGLPVSRKAS